MGNAVKLHVKREIICERKSQSVWQTSLLSQEMDFPGSPVVKNSPANAGNMG